MEMDKYQKLHVKKHNNIRRRVILKSSKSGLKLYKIKQIKNRRLQRIVIQRLKFKVQIKKHHGVP